MIPLIKNEFKTKMCLNNFLILNNQHQGGFSFTLLLDSVKYSSKDFIEYVLQTISLMLMLYQAIRNNSNN